MNLRQLVDDMEDAEPEEEDGNTPNELDEEAEDDTGADTASVAGSVAGRGIKRPAVANPGTPGSNKKAKSAPWFEVARERVKAKTDLARRVKSLQHGLEDHVIANPRCTYKQVSHNGFCVSRSCKRTIALCYSCLL